MRLNLKGAISFETENIEEVEVTKEEFEKHCDTKRVNQSYRDLFFYSERDKKYYRKCRIILDFGLFKRELVFDTVEDMEVLIEKVFKVNYKGVSRIKNI